MEDKLSPSIHYLRKLGVEHIQQIFESSRWIFELDSDRAFEVGLNKDLSFAAANHVFQDLYF